MKLKRILNNLEVSKQNETNTLNNVLSGANSSESLYNSDKF